MGILLEEETINNIYNNDMKKMYTFVLAMAASIGLALADGTLDPDYTYTDPTVVTNSEEAGSNLDNYSFVCNNVLVQVTRGARYADYFGINAGYAVTFTTTQPMKALVVNGYVKKGFEADATAGEIAYADASDDALTSEQVLAVTNINATTVTINCVKQMRCYSVSIYFEENPEVDIESGEEEDVYSYEWEPTEATQLSITFDTLEYLDMSENLGYACSSLYFMSDEYEMELSVFAAGTGDDTFIAPGTYVIDSTYAEGTVMASPGGDDYYDYPSYLITDFEYDSEYDQWVYNTAYYLVSGTLEVLAVEGGVKMNIHATSYYGTTVNATYMHAEGEPSDRDALDNTTALPKTTKTISNGMLLIRRNGKTYTAIGNEL